MSALIVEEIERVLAHRDQIIDVLTGLPNEETNPFDRLGGTVFLHPADWPDRPLVVCGIPVTYHETIPRGEFAVDLDGAGNVHAFLDERAVS